MTFIREPANFDELSDSLKDLNNLRKQLYWAAEYFELSYTNEDQKQIVGKTLKDYAIEALVSTVDHLGSVMFKVNDLLDGKVDEVAEIELRVSCVEHLNTGFLLFLMFSETLCGAIFNELLTESSMISCEENDNYVAGETTDMPAADQS